MGAQLESHSHIDIDMVISSILSAPAGGTAVKLYFSVMNKCLTIFSHILPLKM